MSLPDKNEKGYLEITDRDRGFAITALKAHAAELQPLFVQYGIPCRREADVEPDKDALVFAESADRAKVEQLLEGYEQAKGS
ncbi:MAG TPA: hypothetical protein VG013_00950 [Gemmataceae bacterium]|jgi:hypothetical protein|nr:hypothetical protein [Gemmataceae bacterium]